MVAAMLSCCPDLHVYGETPRKKTFPRLYQPRIVTTMTNKTAKNTARNRSRRQSIVGAGGYILYTPLGTQATAALTDLIADGTTRRAAVEAALIAESQRKSKDE